MSPCFMLLFPETVTPCCNWNPQVTGPTNLHGQFLEMHVNNNTHLTALCPGLPGRAGTRKVKPNWILLKQETVSGSGISWAICKSAPCPRQITMLAPHHSVFLQCNKAVFNRLKYVSCMTALMHTNITYNSTITQNFSKECQIKTRC